MSKLLGLGDVIAEDANDLDFSVATEDEINEAIEGFAGLSSLDRGKFIKRVRKSARSGAGVVPTSDLTAKAEFEKRAAQLPGDIRKLLANRRLQVVDAAYYKMLAVSTTQAEIMLASDNKGVGVTNINNRKLDANEWFLLTGIIVLSGVNATLASTSFAVCADRLLNGEFRLRVGSKTVVDWGSMSKFDTTNRGDVPRGYWKLDNPKMIPPQTEIIPEIRLATAPASNTNVKIILVGAKVEKN